MMKFLRVSISALALAAFVVAPAVTMMTADYAHANNGKGGGGGKGGSNGGGNGGGNGSGGGNGNGGGGNGNGGGKSADNGNKGWGGDKASKGQGARSAKADKGSASKNGGKGFGRAIKDDFNSLSRNLKKNGLAGLFTGQHTQQTKQTQRSTPKATKQTSAPKTSDRPPSRTTSFKTDAMHPSNLGKLNGAINSSPRAKQAHIENGQYMKGTGPVSLAAGLAVADFTFNDVLGPDNTLSPQEVQAINAAYQVRDTTTLTQDAAEAILADSGAFAPEQVAEAQAVREAYELTTDDAGVDIGRPSEDQVAAAEAVRSAEDNLLGQYNGSFSQEEMVAVAQRSEVLGAVRASNPDGATVRTSLGADDTGLSETDEGVIGDDDVTEEAVDESIEDEIATNG